MAKKKLAGIGFNEQEYEIVKAEAEKEQRMISQMLRVLVLEALKARGVV